MQTLMRDLRQGFRVLARNPGFASVAVLSLALGIGVNTAIFSAVEALFLRSVPVEDPSRLVSVLTLDQRNPGYMNQSYPNYKDYRDVNQVFSGLALYTSMPLSLNQGGEPQRILGQIVSGNYFDVLGVRPVVGRGFLPEEDRAPGEHAVAVISYGLWTRKYNSDAAIVGRTIHLNGRQFTIVGVAPKGFRGINLMVAAEVWVPMMMYDQVFPMARAFNSRRALLFVCIGRLKNGITRGQAEAGMKTVAAQLEQTYRSDNEGRTVMLLPLAEATIHPRVRGEFLRAGQLLSAVVALVLVIACINVGNLLLARAGTRRKEIAIRLSLGSGRGRIIHQLVTESVLLALLGGMVSTIFAWWGTALLWSLRPPFLGSDEVRPALNVRVLLFTATLSILTGVLFGLVPALQASRPDLVTELKERTSQFLGTRKRASVRRLLVTGQLALSLVALIGAGLFIRSLQNAERVDPGFETGHLLVLCYDVVTNAYTEARGREFHGRVLERVRALPVVESASLAANYPFGPAIARTIFIEGQETSSGAKGTLVLLNHVEPEYFQTVGIPLTQGRSFTPLDDKNGPRVAIINQIMANHFWPSKEGSTAAIGKRFRFFGENEPWQVVGIARDANYLTLGEKPRASMYVPLAQLYSSSATLHVRTAGDPATVLNTIRREVQMLDANLLLRLVQTMPEIINESLWAPRTGARLLSGFGLLALTLAVVGIYGVISYSVSQRAREIGIRMALGATPWKILREVLGEGAGLVGAGLAAGLGCALLVMHLLASFLLDVSTFDPLTFVAVSLLLGAVALAACYLPARRATTVHPATALRWE
jgi:macrolide transport system ATP-binding/permease protein